MNRLILTGKERSKPIFADKGKLTIVLCDNNYYGDHYKFLPYFQLLYYDLLLQCATIYDLH
jgi:hypothetical protein